MKAPCATGEVEFLLENEDCIWIMKRRLSYGAYLLLSMSFRIYNRSTWRTVELLEVTSVRGTCVKYSCITDYQSLFALRMDG